MALGVGVVSRIPYSVRHIHRGQMQRHRFNSQPGQQIHSKPQQKSSRAKRRFHRFSKKCGGHSEKCDARFRRLRLRSQVQNAPTANSSASTDNVICFICQDRQREVAFVPCGHFFCCSPCAEGLYTTTCPICRTPIENKLHKTKIIYA